MNGKKILITGGAGFVGSNLIKALTVQYPKSKIVVLDNYSTGKLENIKEYSIDIHKGKCEDIGEIFKNDSFDIVYHFGEYSRITTSFKDIETVIESNLTGTSRVLEYCRQNKAKLIYSASSSKFGNNGADENLSPYAWVKAKMVEMIKNYHEWYNLQYEICYFYNVYGPGQITEGDYATVVGIFERQYKQKDTLTVVLPGTQTRDFTHVFDIVDGVIKATLSEKNSEWHLRSGEVISLIQLADLFDTEWKFISERRGERLGATATDSLTNDILNWKTKYNIKEYIQKIIKNGK
tara:strand:- start:8461 stop:9339 length:879 start_codon:yes stop_codon:yes gene_type:complete